MKRITWRGAIALALAATLVAPAAARAEPMQGYWVDEPAPPPPLQLKPPELLTPAEAQRLVDRGGQMAGGGTALTVVGAVLWLTTLGLLVATALSGLANAWTCDPDVSACGAGDSGYGNAALVTGVAAVVAIAAGVPLMVAGSRERNRGRRALDGPQVSFAPRIEGQQVAGGSLGVRWSF
jgi:hypothetical protein